MSARTMLFFAVVELPFLNHQCLHGLKWVVASRCAWQKANLDYSHDVFVPEIVVVVVRVDKQKTNEDSVRP